MMRQMFVALAILGELHRTVGAAGGDEVRRGSRDSGDRQEDPDRRRPVQERSLRPDDRSGHVSGPGTFRFLVDTGADRTAISRDLAKRLSLAPGTTGVASHHRRRVHGRRRPMFPISSSRKRPQNVVDAPLLDSSNMGADGILGVDSLRSQRVQFDFGTRPCRSSRRQPATSAMSRARSSSRRSGGRAAGGHRRPQRRTAADRRPRYRGPDQHRQ